MENVEVIDIKSTYKNPFLDVEKGEILMMKNVTIKGLTGRGGMAKLSGYKNVSVENCSF